MSYKIQPYPLIHTNNINTNTPIQITPCTRSTVPTVINLNYVKVDFIFTSPPPSTVEAGHRGNFIVTIACKVAFGFINK